MFASTGPSTSPSEETPDDLLVSEERFPAQRVRERLCPPPTSPAPRFDRLPRSESRSGKGNPQPRPDRGDAPVTAESRLTR